MSRYKRFYQDCNIYHVMIRCNNRQMLLRKHSTKMLLLKSLGKFQQRLDFRIYGYVIMDNHAHWLIEIQGKHGLSVVMQKILLSFGRYFRKNNTYVGHFWQGRFKSVAITTDKSMIEVLKYVHGNPLKAKIVDRIEDYVYSSAYKYSNIKNDILDGVLVLTRYGDTSVGSCELIMS
ncbi:MAG: transposase [Candidatus Omnitrophica bacterium]|nr:transposase [Candidatus Omnitrophota bacterium]